MFEWINKQGVRSDSGIVLQRMHRFYYHYFEGDHVLKIIVEPKVKGDEINFANTLAWEPPFENELISGIKNLEIERQVREALDFMRMKYTIRRL
jgi:hypothetical protein